MGFLREQKFEDFLPSGICSQSHYISVPWLAIFTETEYKIWGGFGPVGSTENFELGCKICYF